MLLFCAYLSTLFIIHWVGNDDSSHLTRTRKPKIQYNRAWTNWPEFSRQHFQLLFLDRKISIHTLIQISLNFIPRVQSATISAVSGYGLYCTYRRKTITQINIGLVLLWCMASLSLSLNELSHPKFRYRKVSSTRRTKSQNLNDSRLVLQLSLPNPLKPCLKLRMKM